MTPIGLDHGVHIALTALHSDRLAMLCGAGLSMAPPSRLPSAASVAADAKREYAARFGAQIPDQIEAQAEFFLGRGELQTVYLRTLIDRNIFASPPNDGHNAIADLMMVRGIEVTISTNVDSLIETAGTLLHGQIGAGFDRATVAALPPGIAPLLKIHGCWGTNADSTIWTPEQLLIEPWSDRIAALSPWVSTQLEDRDLLIIGFWTDWPYINQILEETLGNVRPASVVVVDLGDANWLAEKAPSLNALGERANTSFYHVQESAAVFLDRLRVTFSQSYLRHVLANGAPAYQLSHSAQADPQWLLPPDLASYELWQIRRDLEGCRPNHPALAKIPKLEPLLGEMLLTLRSNGATVDGAFWDLNGTKLRVINGSMNLLSALEEEYKYDSAPAASADIVIAVGAVSNNLPADIIRSSTESTIARGITSRWLTREDAIAVLGVA